MMESLVTSLPTANMDLTLPATNIRRVEQKYLLPCSLVESVMQWAKERLQIDDHCGQIDSYSYAMTTLYLDTPDWDIYHRNTEKVRNKHRLRRYGIEPVIWLETKRKRKQIVKKRRTPIESQQTLRVWEDSSANHEDWHGAWFQQKISDLELRPTVIVRYQRAAFVGESNGSPLRLTIDRAIRAERAEDRSVPHYNEQGTELLQEAQVLELKFNDFLPPLFQQLLLDFHLTPAQFSKYRTAVSRLGLAPDSEERPYA